MKMTDQEIIKFHDSIMNNIEWLLEDKGVKLWNTDNEIVEDAHQEMSSAIYNSLFAMLNDGEGV